MYGSVGLSSWMEGWIGWTFWWNGRFGSPKEDFTHNTYLHLNKVSVYLQLHDFMRTENVLKNLSASVHKSAHVKKKNSWCHHTLYISEKVTGSEQEFLLLSSCWKLILQWRHVLVPGKVPPVEKEVNRVMKRSRKTKRKGLDFTPICFLPPSLHRGRHLKALWCFFGNLCLFRSACK